MEVHAYDMYRDCEKWCTHDLAQGALVTDLREGDGPFDWSKWEKDRQTGSNPLGVVLTGYPFT